MKILLRCIPLAGVLAVLVVAAACGPRVTRENFEAIEVGMSEDAVHRLLGDPDEEDGASLDGFGVQLSGGTQVWVDGDKRIEIVFVNDEVKLKRATGF